MDVMNQSHILVVEDERDIAVAIEAYLSNQGYKVSIAGNGIEALEIVESTIIDLAIVDVMMPKMDGITFTMKLRENYHFPVIMLSAKSEEVDQIMGLNMGADDYVTKPFRPLELLARVNSQLRRYKRFSTIKQEENHHLMTIGGLEMNTETKEFTVDEIKGAIRKGVKEGTIYPVYCGSGQNNIGVRSLMDGIGKYLPAPSEIEEIARNAETAEPVELVQSDEETTAAVVFKTIADPYVGKMSLFRVYSGEVKADSSLYNPNRGCNEKIGKLYMLSGKKQEEVKKVKAGDIGCVAKLEKTKTGDTLCDKGKNIILTGIEFPAPVLSMAVAPKTKGDEEKIVSGLSKLADEDPTFTVTTNSETKQTLINGQGEQHIDVIVSKLMSKYGTAVVLSDPIVPYRETILGTATVEGKHKKQSGGHGQYGHVKIEFAPGATEDMVFEEKVFGGSVPKNYFPAVEKGLRDSCKHGVLAGYPMVNIKATLLDGSYHPVDSSEMAFKTAASIAYKEGIKQAKPVLLEPIGYLKVYIPENIMGDIIGDINKRRGQIMGMGESDREGLSMVEAEVPMSEMFKYAVDLRSMSQGRGEFTFEFTRYDQAPANIAEKVIAASQNKG